MKKLAILFAILGTFTSTAFSQNIGISFDELGTKPCIDGHTELILNPDLGDLPSAEVYVGAWDLSELFGYEYKLASNDPTAIVGTPIFYPSTSSNSGINGDVRVGTGACFHVGDAEAGPDPEHIRLAKHIYSWVTLPLTDVLFCISPSAGSQASAPQYTECVDSPVPLPFGLHDLLAWWQTYIPPGCIVVIFDSEPPQSCSEVVTAGGRSWGALKAAY